MTFSIYMLPEGLITVTGTNGGNGLDGVNQGSGVHLAPTMTAPGATITLNSNAWQEIQIDDNDDNFGDSDSGQRLVNSETVEISPGVTETFAANTVVEAEYSVVVADPSGTQYTLVAVNFSTGSPVFGTVEGLSLIHI